MDIEMAELDILTSRKLDWMQTRRLVFEYTTLTTSVRSNETTVSLDEVAH